MIINNSLDEVKKRESALKIIKEIINDKGRDSLYDVTGLAMIFRNSKFDHMAMVRAFSENIIDCIPLILYPQENDSHIFFTLTYPIPTMEEYDCFIIDADGYLIGNADCHYLECLCGEWWYDVNLTLAPGKYQTDQVVYLVWVD